VPETLLDIKERLARRSPMGSCLSEDEIGLFETQHSIKLPDQYRKFLLEVGNGGIGPPFINGLAKLGEVASDMHESQKHNWSRLPNIANPFPFTEGWCWEHQPKSDQGPLEQVDHGSIYLGNDGCGQYWHLIVSGAERGNIWQLTGEGITPTIPKRTFLQWYSDWLDGVDNWFAPA